MNHRYDFLFIFDCQDANPNGDPDAGNLPRIDVETGQGLVTDVCLKRKIRNFVQTSRPDQLIYFKEGAVHNNQHDDAYTGIGEGSLSKEAKKKPTPEIKDKATAWMCKNYYDVRTFGAVMSTEVNCGQVRGPVQISFARSIDPIVSSEHAITRTSVTKTEDIQKERTMGRKFTIPYGLYKAQGFVNPFLAKDTGFDDDDLELLFQSLENAFQFDQSAARPAGSMNPRALIVFKHEGTDTNPQQKAQQAKLGCAPSHKLFETVTLKLKDGIEVPRSFSDYDLTIGGNTLDEFMKDGGIQNEKGIWEKPLGNGITLIRRI